jgi:hypothetical protein
MISKAFQKKELTKNYKKTHKELKSDQKVLVNELLLQGM